MIDASPIMGCFRYGPLNNALLHVPMAIASSKQQEANNSYMTRTRNSLVLCRFGRSLSRGDCLCFRYFRDRVCLLTRPYFYCLIFVLIFCLLYATWKLSIVDQVRPLSLVLTEVLFLALIYELLIRCHTVALRLTRENAPDGMHKAHHCIFTYWFIPNHLSFNFP